VLELTAKAKEAEDNHTSTLLDIKEKHRKVSSLRNVGVFALLWRLMC
jgi:hypothetical protein